MKKVRSSSSSTWPAPKRGKTRALKKPSTIMKKKPFVKVPYVRHGKTTQKSRKEKEKWGRSVQMFLNKGPLALIKLLTKDGILQKPTKCPHCASASVGPLKYCKQWNGYVYRCSKRACHCRIWPHSFHPIFYHSKGKGSDLNMQASVLFCATIGIPQVSTHLLFDVDAKAVARIYNNLEIARVKFVRRQEKAIVYGGWCDVEARAPGPGPIRKRDWKPIAHKHLLGRRVILHTDGARAYKMKLDKVIHCNVVHKQKKKIVRGKAWYGVKG